MRVYLFTRVAQAERQLAAHHLIQHDPSAPHVCLLCIAALEHFGGHVPHGASQLSQHLRTGMTA